MGIRKYKPTTPGRRGSSVADFVEITRSEPEKSLVRPLHSKGGRNNHGRITTRHQGGGHKRAYRVIDFRRRGQGRRAGQGRAHRVRPEPHGAHRAAALRGRREALHHLPDQALSRATPIETGPGADIKPGNNLPLRNIPLGTVVHAIELRPGGGAKIARSAGAERAAAWPRKAASRSCACPPARSATSTCAAAPPSARSATPSSPTSTGARPAACAGRASARPSAVWS